ncbi:MAG: DUF2334 domain-containing protein, partial [Candidatus Dormibacteraeota bacterium]|nr:DUF2334 domain-containing protein [Candidatus Dormibacteraeota bacterium]
ELVVAVHDVMEGTLTGVRSVLADLDRIGVSRRTLLVVPGGPRRLCETPALRDLLSGEVRRGAEVVAHGWTHRGAGPARGTPATRARAALFARGVAEFAALDRAGATLAAGNAREELARAGFEVDGFCAPGWLEAPWVPAALRAAGYRFNVRMASITDLRDGTRRRVGWRGYLGAGTVQEVMLAAGARALAALPGRPPASQVFLHPQGNLRGTPYRNAIEEVGRLLDRGHRLVRFRDLL